MDNFCFGFVREDALAERQWRLQFVNESFRIFLTVREDADFASSRVGMFRCCNLSWSATFCSPPHAWGAPRIGCSAVRSVSVTAVMPSISGKSLRGPRCSFGRMRLTNCTVYDARYFRAAQALGVSSATRLNGKSAKPGSTEAR